MTDADKIRELVGALVDRSPSEVTLDSWPTEYGTDSLSILVFREQCENMFGIVIPDDDWGDMRQLKDILTYIGSDPQDGNAPAVSIAASGTSHTHHWGSGFFFEKIEIGMPLTGINHLSESALLKYLGDLRWRHMTKISGVQSRELVDSTGTRLYPTFFYVELYFPLESPMASYGENDSFEIADSVSRFGHSILDGVAYLIPSERHNGITRPPSGMEDAAEFRIPAVRMSNIFVSMFDGAQWLKRGRPREGLIDGIPELKVAPDSTTIARRSERDGYVEYPDETFLPLRDGAIEYDYNVQADRDVNGAGLLYFANYPVFLDLAERNALQRASCQWPDELINKRSIVNRKIAYLSNASWKDSLKIATRLWIKKAYVGCDDNPPKETIHIFAVQQMLRASDGRLMCLSSSRKLLYGAAANMLDWADLSCRVR